MAGGPGQVLGKSWESPPRCIGRVLRRTCLTEVVMRMRFAVLGSLEVSAEEQRIAVGGPQQRALLAVLLLNAGTVVPMDRLVESLWGRQPPPTARGLLQGCVSGLRRVLRPGLEPGRQLLVRRNSGYCLQLRPGELDLHRFDELVAAADRLAASELPAAGEQAADLLGEALALWRGPVLGGAVPDVCRPEATRLAERRLAVLEQRINLDLRAGRHAGLVGELESLVQTHPLREGLWAQLMCALHGAGRQADALAAYQRVRSILVEQLGVEPAAPLRQLHSAILSGAEPSAIGEPRTENPAATASPRSVPAQLPPAVAAFTGRDAQLRQLDELLPAEGCAARIGVLSGTAGVGKTALAVCWAHRVRKNFGDGQLYVDLRGFAAAPPLRAIEAVTRFLQALGTPPEDIPVELDQATALYRSLLADRRMLVILDNAGNAGQVRPLLPGSPGCVVLVTSRDRLAGLIAHDGARPVAVDVLDRRDAVTLLARVLRDGRIAAEPQESAELAERCGRLPLALRIAAANLAWHPGHRIADQVADLVEAGRLNALQINDDDQSAVRAAFALSYHALAGPERVLFRRLGLVPGLDFTAPTAAALAASTLDDARRRLERLAGTHLLARHGDRYVLHDLLRLYAKERTDGEDTEQQHNEAIRRLGDWYLHTADAAARLLYPTAVRLALTEPANQSDPFADHTAALAWLDAEAANLVTVVQQGTRPLAWLLADTLRGYFMLRVLPVEWAAAAGAALSAAEAAADPKAQMASQLSIAGLHMRQSRFGPAIEHYRRTLALSEHAGWPEGESAARGNLGTVFLSFGRLPEAADHFARALEVDRRTGCRGGQAARLGNLGVTSKQLGRLEQAAAQLREALALFDELGSRDGQALAMANLGAVQHLLGHFPDALRLLNAAAALHQEIGDRGTEGDDRNYLAQVHRDTGQPLAALDLADTALTRAIEVGERYYEAEAHNVIGSIHLRLGAPRYAEEHHRNALDVADHAEVRLPKVAALIGLADARRQAGDPDQARQHAVHAVTLSQANHFRVQEGEAEVALAEALIDLGRLTAAVSEATHALDIQRATGHRLGAARAQLTLGRALTRADPGAAHSHLRQARRTLADIGAADPDQPNSG
ncbi:tetratricopeptide repeat protein [Amycolatopsis sp. H6(2020)]|nr:tetratricopeptide repeat protein [Amycolatopsis sp. H6(2020)]